MMNIELVSFMLHFLKSNSLFNFADQDYISNLVTIDEADHAAKWYYKNLDRTYHEVPSNAADKLPRVYKNFIKSVNDHLDKQKSSINQNQSKIPMIYPVT
jgi:hypothetical protein